MDENFTNLYYNDFRKQYYYLSVKKIKKILSEERKIKKLLDKIIVKPKEKLISNILLTEK